MASSDEKNAKSHPKVKEPIDSKGLPIHVHNVPGLSRKAGTPGWVSGPAKSAARSAK